MLNMFYMCAFLYKSQKLQKHASLAAPIQVGITSAPNDAT